MKKIALLIPHIGEFKNYFPFFLTSCINNPSVDFLFFTDNKKYLDQSDLPLNIKFVEMSFEKIQERAQKLFDYKITLQNPYKICDFRPCFGLMFGDFLNNYDYWGHCDTDMIFGDMYNILNEILESGKYGRVFRHGHLSIYKNDEFSNNIFKKYFKDITSSKSAFTTPKVLAFDEAGAPNYPGTAIIWLNYYPEKLYENLKIFANPICNKRSFYEGIKKGKYRFYKYKGGRLYDCFYKKGKVIEEEILYVHFYRRKLDYNISEKSNNFIIIPNKIVKYNDSFSFLKRIALTYKPLFYWEYYYSRIKHKYFI